jgi:hypothetical protein
MAQMILHDYKTFMQQDYEVLSLGIKPSGRPHIGSIATFVAALDYAANNPSATINLQIMDLDFDSQRGNAFTPFIHQQDESGRSVRESLRRDLDEVIEIMGSVYSLDVRSRMQIDFFSEFLLLPETLNKFLSIFSDREKTSALNYALFDAKIPDKAPVSGICPSCHTSSSTFARRSFRTDHIARLRGRIDFLKSNALNLDSAVVENELNELEKRISAYESRLRSVEENSGGGPEYFLKSQCENSECAVDSYDFDMRKGMYNIHYLVDPLRDEMLIGDGKAAHIFGGDYAKPHGIKHIPKAERIRNALVAVDSMRQDFFIGPLINFMGQKMGKSGMAVPFQDLSRRKQKLVVEYIHELYERGSREIAYEDMARRLK